ncbi:MAG: ATPase domain-containing protein [Candidatus Hydrothermarchaeota archaeon]
MEKIKTGIRGLDGILYGGLPKEKVILVTGGPGTGKSIFCMQFLYNGAKEYGEPGVFVAIEERPKDIRENMKSLGWDIKELEDKKLLAIIDAASARHGIPSEEKYVESRVFDIDTLIHKIVTVVEEIGAKRIVIDSIPSLGLRLSEDELRAAIYRLQGLLLELGCTTFIVSEIKSGSDEISRYGFEEFISHGVIILELVEHSGDMIRRLWVRKMRGTPHKMKKYPFEITSEGIVIYPTEELGT